MVVHDVSLPCMHVAACGAAWAGQLHGVASTLRPSTTHWHPSLSQHQSTQGVVAPLLQSHIDSALLLHCKCNHKCAMLINLLLMFLRKAPSKCAPRLLLPPPTTVVIDTRRHVHLPNPDLPTLTPHPR